MENLLSMFLRQFSELLNMLSVRYSQRQMRWSGSFRSPVLLPHSGLAQILVFKAFKAFKAQVEKRGWQLNRETKASAESCLGSMVL